MLKIWHKISIEKLALFAVLALGTCFIFVFPPNSAPDEAVHFASAYQNASAVLGETSPDVSMMTIREADKKLLTEYSNYPDRHTYEYFSEELFKPIPPDEMKTVEITRGTGVPYPYIYAPQTIGVLLGRIINANPEWLYLLGRIFNLIFYAVCVWLAVKLTPIGKGVLAIVALFPMAMELAASHNPDTFSTAFAFIAIAQYLRIAYGDGPTRALDLWLLLATMLAMGPPKVIFFPILMLLFFMPTKCFAEKKYAVIFRIIVAVSTIVVLSLTLYLFMSRGGDGTPIVTRPGEVIYSVSDLLADPILFAKMCKRTLEMGIGYFLFSMMGTDLGWIEIQVPEVLVWIILVFVVLAAFKEKDEDLDIKSRDKIQFVIIFFLAALGTAVTMFLLWTPVGSWKIEGIQGRYYLPVFPLLILALARWKQLPSRPTWLSDKNLILYVCLLEILILIFAHSFIAGREPVHLVA